MSERVTESVLLVRQNVRASVCARACKLVSGCCMCVRAYARLCVVWHFLCASVCTCLQGARAAGHETTITSSTHTSVFFSLFNHTSHPSTIPLLHVHDDAVTTTSTNTPSPTPTQTLSNIPSNYFFLPKPNNDPLFFFPSLGLDADCEGTCE